jgi:hypothetical protein
MSEVFIFLEEEYKKNFLYNKITYNSVITFLNEPNNILKYDNAVRELFIMKNNIDKDVNKILRNNSRILCTMPDGQVWFDSGKDNNTYQNFKSKNINENHNTRISIFEALRNYVGKEIKFSNSTGSKEEYYANSINNVPSISLGVLRLSVN